MQSRAGLKKNKDLPFEKQWRGPFTTSWWKWPSLFSAWFGHFFFAFALDSDAVYVRQLLNEGLASSLVLSAYVTRTPARRHSSSLWTTSWKCRVVLSWSGRAYGVNASRFVADFWWHFAPKLFHSLHGLRWFAGCSSCLKVRYFWDIRQALRRSLLDSTLLGMSFVPFVVRWCRTDMFLFLSGFSLRVGLRVL